MPQTSNLHVLIANNIYPPIMAGGAELIVAYLAEELVRRGNRVTVVSTCGPQMEPYAVEQRNGVEVLRFFPRNRYWSFDRAERGALDKVRWHLTDAWNRDAGRRLGEIMASHRPDVLHTHLIDGFSAAIWGVAKRQGIPVLHTAHDYHLICPRAFMLSKSWKICRNPSLGCRMFRAWHIATTRHVDLFCSPSRFLIEQHQAAGLRTAATEVVRNGIPLPTVAGEARPTQPGLRLLFLARLTPEKGVRTVLEAMKLLPADLPIQLDIGGKGPLAGEVEAAAKADPRINYHGYVQAELKQRLFAEADAVLLPSLWYENAPVVIVEAAAHGLGVIGSDIGAIPEFVRHEETGLLFEAGAAPALAEAIRRIAAEPQLRALFKANGTTFATQFSVEAMTDAYSKLYDRLTAGARRETAPVLAAPPVARAQRRAP